MERAAEVKAEGAAERAEGGQPYRHAEWYQRGVAILQ
jgi:hypothetical protein